MTSVSGDKLVRMMVQSNVAAARFLCQERNMLLARFVNLKCMLANPVRRSSSEGKALSRSSMSPSLRRFMIPLMNSAKGSSALLSSNQKPKQRKGDGELLISSSTSPLYCYSL